MNLSWIVLFGAMRIFIMSALLWEDLLRFLLKLSFCPASKQKFKFIFDFGDDWCVEHEVLREIETEDEE